MRKILVVFAVAAAVCAAALSPAFAAEKEKAKKEELKYLGNKQCLMCHEDRDNGPSVWRESAHAKAYESLASDKALKHSKDPRKDPKCLQCHVAGLGKPGGFSIDMDDKKKEAVKGVTCEACHGPGQKYIPLMVKAKSSDAKLSDKELAEAGLIKPDEKKCLECHNEKSPFFQKFNFKERLKKISHGVLLEEKGEK